MGDLVQQLKEYFNKTPKEQLERDWNEIKIFNQIRPTVEDYIATLKNKIIMNKFTEILSQSGNALLKRRAANLSTDVYESAMDKKRDLEKQIRVVKAQITNLEDLSIKSTESLVVGENLNASGWVEQRLNLALDLRDLNIQLDEMNKLIDEYFAEPESK